MPKFVVLTIDAPTQPAANTWWAGKGLGPTTLGAPLVDANGPANAQPATHYMSSARESVYVGEVQNFLNAFPTATGATSANISSSQLNQFVLDTLAPLNLQKQTAIVP